MLAASVATLFHGRIVYAQTTGTVDVTASAGSDSNPFLFAGANTEAASFRLEMIPTITHSDGRSDFKLRASAQHIEFSRRYKSAQNFGIDATASHRVNAAVDIKADLGMSSAVSISDFGVAPGGVGFEPNPDDVTLTGSRRRRTAYRLGSEVTYIVSGRDQLRWSSTANFVRTDRSVGLSEYDFVSHSIGYARKLNEGLSLGMAVTASLNDFKYTRFSDAELLSPQLAIEAKLNARLDLKASLGATFTRINLFTGKQSFTAFSGSGSICYKGNPGQGCLSAQRQVTPTILGGLRTYTSLGASYSLRVSEFDSFTANGSYGRASEPFLGGQRALRYIYTQARYERKFNQTLTGFVSAGYNDNSDSTISRKASVRAMLGVTYRFGASR
jgi:hypothetical protein